MKALIIAPRFPWPAYTGERLRATIWLSALSRSADVTLVAPPGPVPGGAPRFRFHAAKPSPGRFFEAARALMFDRIPLQCLLSAPYDWSAAIDRARREAGSFDVTVVILSRMDPWVRGSLEGWTVLDAVDSLRVSAGERRRAAGRATRWLWTIEERRMARLESDAARRYDRIVVVSEEESVDLEQAVAVTNGISASPLGHGTRAFDFGFWGRFPYFANADAAAWLLDEIWPVIRAHHPGATLILGGADAPRSLRRAVRDAGATLVSPVENIGAFARNIRVALMPLRYGSGQSNKVLEAAEAGCAVAGTPLALRGLPALVPHSRIESSAEDLARAAVALLDESRRAPLAARLREAVETHYARAATLDRLCAIAAGAGAS